MLLWVACGPVSWQWSVVWRGVSNDASGGVSDVRVGWLQSYDEKTEIVIPTDGHLDDEEALHNQLIKRHLEASIAAAAAVVATSGGRGRGRGRGGR